MGEIKIMPMAEGDIPEAAEVVASAFYTAPLIATVFRGSGEKQLKQQRMGWLRMLKVLGGEKLLARDGDEIVGVMRMAQWPECQMKPIHKLIMLPGMLIALGGVVPRVLKFRGAWEARDPKVPHWHIDPITVKPGRQGQGIGSMFMERFCQRCDADAMPAYFETDREINLKFYGKFGFKVIEELPIFGHTTWLLWRDPVAGTESGS